MRNNRADSLRKFLIGSVQRAACDVRRNAAQSTIEFAVLIIVIIAAFIAMQVYLKRGVQGRLRGSIDSIGEQYDPQATTSSFQVSRRSNTVSNMVSQGAKVSVTLSDGTVADDIISVSTSEVETVYDDSTRSGWETVAGP